jgi:hypothetical protein
VSNIHQKPHTPLKRLSKEYARIDIEGSDSGSTLSKNSFRGTSGDDGKKRKFDQLKYNGAIDYDKDTIEIEDEEGNVTVVNSKGEKVD